MNERKSNIGEPPTNNEIEAASLMLPNLRAVMIQVLGGFRGGRELQQHFFDSMTREDWEALSIEVVRNGVLETDGYGVLIQIVQSFVGKRIGEIDFPPSQENRRKGPIKSRLRAGRNATRRRIAKTMVGDTDFK